MLTMEYTGTLVIETCCHENCGMTFAMPDDFNKQKRRDHAYWYCPRGHSQHYTGESDLEAAKRRENQAHESERFAWTAAEAARDQAQAAQRSASALRGHLTRVRNKIANGVCPVPGCRRHFDNVQAHIASQHPDFRVTDPESGRPTTVAEITHSTKEKEHV